MPDHNVGVVNLDLHLYLHLYLDANRGTISATGEGGRNKEPGRATDRDDPDAAAEPAKANSDPSAVLRVFRSGNYLPAKGSRCTQRPPRESLGFRFDLG